MGMGAANAAPPAAGENTPLLLRKEGGGQDAAKKSATSLGSSAPASPSTTTAAAAVAPLTSTDTNVTTGSMRGRTQWLWLALASGICAALNGAFAKLSTTELTSSFAERAAAALGLTGGRGGAFVEYGLRGAFFISNLISNGIMWALFTAALARGTSTTQVSVVNTSSNFLVTALLGAAIFGERLPPLWWLGAGLLVAGNVIVGRGRRHHDDDNDKDGRTGDGDDDDDDDDDVDDVDDNDNDNDDDS